MLLSSPGTSDWARSRASCRRRGELILKGGQTDSCQCYWYLLAHSRFDEFQLGKRSRQPALPASDIRNLCWIAGPVKQESNHRWRCLPDNFFLIHDVAPVLEDDFYACGTDSRFPNTPPLQHYDSGDRRTRDV